jgi:hypothetical protein
MIVTFDHTDTDLLTLFDISRKKLIGMYSGKIIENYKVENFNYQDQTAFSIGYKNNKPYLFSTIFRRTSWPKDCYRILNRTWKLNRQDHISKEIDPLFKEMVESQIHWLNKNLNPKTIFISREHNSRNTLINVRNYLNTGELKFILLEELICVSQGDPKVACQDILFTGESEVFKEWPKSLD